MVNVFDWSRRDAAESSVTHLRQTDACCVRLVTRQRASVTAAAACMLLASDQQPVTDWLTDWVMSGQSADWLCTSIHPSPWRPRWRHYDVTLSRYERERRSRRQADVARTQGWRHTDRKTEDFAHRRGKSSTFDVFRCACGKSAIGRKCWKPTWPAYCYGWVHIDIVHKLKSINKSRPTSTIHKCSLHSQRHRSVVKYWGQGQSGQAWFRRLEKLVLPSIFDTSLSSSMMWNLQSYPTTVLNERMWYF